MRRRFFWAIFGVAAGVILVLLVLAVGSINRLRTEATRNELQRAGDAVVAAVLERVDDAGLLSTLLRGETAGERLGAVVEVARRAAGGADVTFFAIAPNGDVVGRPVVEGLDLPTAAVLAGETRFVERSAGRGPFLGYVAPVGELPVRGVTVAVLVSTRAPVELRVPRGLLLGSLLAVGLLAAGLARLLSRGLTARLDRVAGAAGALAEGDLSARSGVEGDDEIGVVGGAFDAMAERLEESRERERRFLLSVGHDLRTPLTTITGYAEALEDGLDDPDEVARIAGVLGVESGRLRRLIEDVMLLARLESAEFDLRPEPVDVAAHVDGLLTPYEDRADAVRVRLVRRIGPTGVRSVDADRVGQILGNLVENALRYTPETGTVTVGVTAVGEEVDLEVTDTGPGIEPEDLPHVFDRFYVAKRYRGVRPEGSGLGLSIVASLAASMGGSVEVESTVGEGTTIRVRLPAPPA